MSSATATAPRATAPRLAALLILMGAPLGAQDGVGFRASVTPDTVYVGQQATYQLSVSIPPDVRQRLRRNPVFVPPEARAMLAYELPAAKRDPTQEGAEVHVFRRALFPLTPGRYQIPPSQLTYALPQSPSFFSREDERTLRSEPVTFVAIEPPPAGRPASWLGAVGVWRVSARTDVREGRVGDPFVLTLRVEGVGNATLLPRPPVAIAWADVVAEDERVVLDTTPTALGGAKEFSWLVTPRTEGAREVPALEFPFFDPVARRYVAARTAPLPLRIRPGDLVRVERGRAATAASDSLLPLRPALEGPRPIALRRAMPWLLAVALAPLPWLVVTLRRRRPRAAAPRRAVDRLAEPMVGAPSALRALFDDALRERTGVRLAECTGSGALAAALRREGVTEETARDAEHLRDLLDASAYAKGARAGDLKERVRTMLRRIGEEARRRASLLLLALALAAVAGCAASGDSEGALVDFTEGQTAYAGRDFVRSRDAFLRAARTAPRDPAAWANLGTAAFHAGDTASAVLGWQRALRLDPLAMDLRSRLGRLRVPQDRGVARVWPLPPLLLAAIAAALWWTAWLLLAVRARRGPAGARWLLLVPATAGFALAAEQERRLRADDLVVIATATPLRALPALGADQGSVPLVGEVVAVQERRGVWLRIELDAGREGWYPAERTYPLRRD